MLALLLQYYKGKLTTQPLYDCIVKDECLDGVCTKNTIKMVHALLEKQPTLAEYAEEALRISAMLNQFEISEELIKHGADVNYKKGTNPGNKLWSKFPFVTPLLNIVGSRPSNNKLPTISLLIKHKANVNDGSLIMAVIMGNINAVKLLLDNNADPNLNVNGMTPLDEAQKHKNKDIYNLLIQRGAKDPTIKLSSPYLKRGLATLALAGTGAYIYKRSRKRSSPKRSPLKRSHLKSKNTKKKRSIRKK
jgi:hypothetical protein